MLACVVSENILAVFPCVVTVWAEECGTGAVVSTIERLASEEYQQRIVQCSFLADIELLEF